MKIHLIAAGKTSDKCLMKLLQNYFQRIEHLINFKYTETNDIKFSKNIELDKIKQWQIIQKYINCNNIILLDETGIQMSSTEFANWLNKQITQAKRCITFVIGGPYGFPDNIKNNFYKIALSKMTFSHQLVRLIFAEQLYRALTILHSKPYHH